MPQPYLDLKKLLLKKKKKKKNTPTVAFFGQAMQRCQTCELGSLPHKLIFTPNLKVHFTHEPRPVTMKL